ncbi:T9SS type A sorting domain-containing protein [Candidatus Amoebophilus asiaticus]|nr:T9SS type A sorting domain-containing protein [Candidatus Amoebophilus asiaticus]
MPKSLANLFKFVLLFCVLFVVARAYGQNIKYCAHDHKSYFIQEKIINGQTKYFDINGNERISHPVYQLSLKERINKGYTSVSPNYNNKTTARPDYTITYIDVVNGTGQGFDDPSLGETRRNTVEGALQSILVMITNTGIMDLEVKESEFDAKGPLASAGALFSGTSGFRPGGTSKHITTGQDPFGPSFPDAEATFDFGYKWNSTLNDPAADEFDLYSVALHELTHAMGFTSLVGSDGESQFKDTNGDNIFMFFDQYIINQSSSELVGGEPPGLQTNSTDVTSNALNFKILDAMIVPLYSPTTFSNGSSMSHLDNSRISGVSYVMHPSITIGTKVRTLHADEINIFPKLGYTIESNLLYNSIDDDIVIQANEFNIYPNPAIDYVNISWKDLGISDFTIRLTNILGSEILTIKSDELTPNTTLKRLDITTFPNGVYFISIDNQHSKVIKKFIKK